MDSLFGDATTVMGTPSLRSETGSIFRGASPVPSLDLRGRALSAESNIPPLDIDPPHVNMVDGKPQIRSESGSRGRVGEWLGRMVGRDRGSSSSPASGHRYAPVDQQGE